MTSHIKNFREGFDVGLTYITRHDDTDEPTAIGVSVLKMEAGETYETELTRETAFLMMDGSAELDVDGRETKFHRTSLFDDQPCCVHAAIGTKIRIVSQSATEFTLYDCANTKLFPVEIYDGSDNLDEHRGKGQVGDTCLRLVRTIFDDCNSHPNADLVLGEVINLPGRWSSYPPHHHSQPEIYHYRFSDPRGWGHAELGEDVIKVRQNDSVRIIDKKSHPQTAAPGYAMYYAWVIRHLPGDRYAIPEFEPEHDWVMKEGAEFWQPDS